MFDIGWSELLVIGIVALIAIGPKELPGALRALGQWTTKIRRMASEFQGQFQEAMREAEMADLKKQVDTLTSGFDPIETARKDIESAMEDKAAPNQAAQTGEGVGGARLNRARTQRRSRPRPQPMSLPSTMPPSPPRARHGSRPGPMLKKKSIEADRPSDLKPEAGRSA